MTEQKDSSYGRKASVYDGMFQALVESERRIVDYQKTLSLGVATKLASELIVTVVAESYENEVFSPDLFLKRAVEFFSGLKLKASILNPDDKLVTIDVVDFGEVKSRSQDLPNANWDSVQELTHALEKKYPQGTFACDPNEFIHEIGELAIPAKGE